MKILVLNSGSSSLKYKLLEMPAETVIASGMIERIGETDADCRNHRDALEIILDALADTQNGCLSSITEIAAVGHRVVHGKDVFAAPIVADARAIAKMKEFIELAPLHQPANISCIEACIEMLPDVPQAAHFDTGFYHTMPKYSRLYPIPIEWHEKYGVRRYGFHGTSHRCVTIAASEMLGIPLDKIRLITAHLGNGASITAFMEGRVIDTSMGFTPLEGLMMGTRAGYLDPAALPYIMSKTGKTIYEVVNILNNESGIAAISGIGRDMRNILEARSKGHERAELAFQMFTHTLRKYIGAYFFALGGADAIVFTGGIGENAREIRGELFGNLKSAGIKLDAEKNKNIVGGKSGVISAFDSIVKVLVIPTNEELMIARETHKLLFAKNPIDRGE